MWNPLLPFPKLLLCCCFSLQLWSTTRPTCVSWGRGPACTSSWGSTRWPWTATGASWTCWRPPTASASCSWPATWPSELPLLCTHWGLLCRSSLVVKVCSSPAVVFNCLVNYLWKAVTGLFQGLLISRIFDLCVWEMYRKMQGCVL